MLNDSVLLRLRLPPFAPFFADFFAGVFAILFFFFLCLCIYKYIEVRECVCARAGVSWVRVDENTRCAMLIKSVLLNIVNIGQFTFSPANGIRM